MFGFLGGIAAFSSRNKVDLGSKTQNFFSSEGAGGLRAGILAFTGGTLLCAATSTAVAFATSKALDVHSVC